MTDSIPQPEIDRLLVRQIARWAGILTVLLAMFDIAMLRSWPFPSELDPVKGVFYVSIAVILLIATVFVTFLGYRIISMRVVRRARSVYFIFLPAVFLFSTIVGFLLLTAPR